MKPIKNEETQALCVELAAMVKQGDSLAASDRLRQWVAARPKIVRWEVLAIQDQIRYLATL